ncbi:MAG: CvpA family protein [Clostridiales bacterium]|nr:CvpA family protein [Clostridiales bacterium]
MGYGVNWMDIAAALILIICIFEGFHRGFILTVFGIAGFFISLYAARAMTYPVLQYITKNTGIYKSVYGYISGKGAPGTNAVQVFKILGAKGEINAFIANSVIIAAIFFVLFAIVRIILSIIARALNTAARLPVIRHFNKAGGFILGAAKGILILYVIFAILTLIMPFLPSNSVIVTSINNSAFASNFYRYNIITPWLMGQIK